MSASFPHDQKEALHYLGRRAGIDIGKPLSPEMRREIEEAKRRREERENFASWVIEERRDVAGKIRQLDRAIERFIVTPDDLGTWLASYFYNERARLEYREDLLRSPEEVRRELWEEEGKPAPTVLYSRLFREYRESVNQDWIELKRCGAVQGFVEGTIKRFQARIG